MTFHHITFFNILLIIFLTIGIIIGFIYFLKGKQQTWKHYPLLCKNDCSHYQLGFLCLSIIMLFPAILGLRNEVHSEQIEQDGIDIAIVLDVSKSMNAIDFEDDKRYYSRLDIAKRIIATIVTKMPENRYSLTIFGGDAVNVCPLTHDTSTFLTFLQGVDYRNISTQGTDLAKAFSLGKKRLLVDTNNSALIFISDGGDTDANIDYQSIEEEYAQFPVYSIVLGIGTKKGSPIPDGQDIFGFSKNQTFEGMEVISKLNTQSLHKLSSKIHAEYRTIESLENDLEINTLLASVQKKSIEHGAHDSLLDMSRYLSMFSFLFFLLSLMTPLLIQSSHIHHNRN